MRGCHARVETSTSCYTRVPCVYTCFSAASGSRGPLLVRSRAVVLNLEIGIHGRLTDHIFPFSCI
jgi:hypothetical protein